MQHAGEMLHGSLAGRNNVSGSNVEMGLRGTASAEERSPEGLAARSEGAQQGSPGENNVIYIEMDAAFAKRAVEGEGPSERHVVYSEGSMNTQYAGGGAAKTCRGYLADPCTGDRRRMILQ